MFETIIREMATRDFGRIYQKATVDEMYSFLEAPRFERNELAVRFLILSEGSDEPEPTIWLVNPEYWKEELYHDFQYKELVQDGYCTIEVSETTPCLPYNFIPEIVWIPDEYFEKLNVLEEYEDFRNKIMKTDYVFDAPEQIFRFFAGYLAKKLNEMTEAD